MEKLTTEQFFTKEMVIQFLLAMAFIGLMFGMIAGVAMIYVPVAHWSEGHWYAPIVGFSIVLLMLATTQFMVFLRKPTCSCCEPLPPLD